MSPCALKDELIDIKRKMKIEPKKIIFKYRKDKSNVIKSLFINLIKEGLKYIPIKVTINATKIESKKDCVKIFPELFKLSSPILLAIKDVVPMLNPTPKAIIMK